MTSLKSNTDQRPATRPWTDPRQLVFVLLSVVMIFGQSSASMAGHGSGGPGLWVEICSEGETYLARVDQGDGGQGDDCVHCPVCLVPGGSVVGFYEPVTGGVITVEFSKISYSIARVIQSTGPEQYWSQCRGPPITSVENNMVLSTTLTINAPALTVANSWGFPWV